MQADYRAMLGKWIGFAKGRISSPRRKSDLAFYSTGQSGHWSVQSHLTALAAVGVLVGDETADADCFGCSHDELSDLYLRMLRFVLQTHRSGSGMCLDGKSWGCSWISCLGFERSYHTMVELRQKGLIDDTLQASIEKLVKTEADWLLDHYEVVADPDNLSGKNKPESNIWNGCMMFRATELLPDDPRREAWQDKARKFFYNGISVTEEADSEEICSGRPLGEWHVGGNFYPSMALNHHGYLNVGYMVICLSNIAMKHFQCKLLGITPPQELYFNAEKLWQLVKGCVAPDGRLLRIGGDTRARYCYCQDYLVPSLLWVQDYLGEDTSAMLQGWAKILERETSYNPDGSFLGGRLATMRENSLLYYLRLEGDRAASLSMACQWLRAGLVGKAQRVDSYPVEAGVLAGGWEDVFHGAVAVRGEKRIASWVWESAEKPMGLCLPVDRSDMAEWQHNMAPEVYGDGVQNEHYMKSGMQQKFAGGFCASGSYTVRTINAMYEGGMGENDIAECCCAVAALPDDNTFINLQVVKTLKGCLLRGWRGGHLLVPNDVYNSRARNYRHENGEFTTKSMDGQQHKVSGSWLEIDGALRVGKIYGDELSVATPAKRQVLMKNSPYQHELGGTIACDEICVGRCDLQTVCEEGQVLIDCGFTVGCSVGDDTLQLSRPLQQKDESAQQVWRGVEVVGADGKRYVFVVSFGDTEMEASFALADGGRLTCLTGDAAVQEQSQNYTVKLQPMQSLLFVVE